MQEIPVGSKVQLLQDTRHGVMAPPRDLIGACGIVQATGKVAGDRTYHVHVSRSYDESRHVEVDECCVRLVLKNGE